MSFAEVIKIMRRFAETKVKQGLVTLNSMKALLVLGGPKVGKSWLIQEVFSSLAVPYLAIDLLINKMMGRLSFLSGQGCNFDKEE